MSYKPEPIDTTGVKLSDDIVELTELLAKNAHDIWARQRIAEPCPGARPGIVLQGVHPVAVTEEHGRHSR